MTACALPVTGSSSMPAPGAKARLTISAVSPGAVTMHSTSPPFNAAMARKSRGQPAHGRGRVEHCHQIVGAVRQHLCGCSRRAPAPGRARRRAPGVIAGSDRASRSPSRSTDRMPDLRVANRIRASAGSVRQQDIAAGQRRVPAHRHLDRRREPAQIIVGVVVDAPHQERGFGQVVLPSRSPAVSRRRATRREPSPPPDCP